MPAINKTSLGLNQWLGNEYPKRIDFVEDNKIIDDELIKRVKYTDVATDTTSGIVKFGTETGNAIDAETWKQAIGQSLGGYISKIKNKEAGKWYINDLTDGKIYKCIQNHTSTSFDITKFVDITNVGLSDKVENLFGNNKNGYLKLGNILIQWGFVSVPTNQYTLIYPVAYKELPSIVISNWSFNGIVTHTGRSQTQCLFSSNTGSMGFDWMTVGVV